MKYFKDKNNGVFAFAADGSEDAFIGDLASISEAEADALRAPRVSPDDQAAAIRAERNAMLATCDWTMLPDAPLSAAQIASWQSYRQALRDLTDQAGFPATVVWPVAP